MLLEGSRNLVRVLKNELRVTTATGVVSVPVGTIAEFRQEEDAGIFDGGWDWIDER